MIRVLDKHVADKIAAGEVIDRPVSIIKELVENSLDAGADNITIEIKNGGKSYIRVTDNGSGIPSEEAELAFKRHATSKISAAEDLDAIETLGFRGEALASICAVARVELITKTRESKVGRKLVIEGSDVVENVAIGCPDGTTITVRDLFFNVPARNKFLASDSAETRRITDMVSRIALSYTDVKFTLINGNTKIFSTRGNGNIHNNIISIYGSDIGKDLIPVDKAADGFTIKGFVSSPGTSLPSRSKQIFCVNGRVVSSSVLEKALDEAYREKMFHGRFPIAFLFLALPADKIDVNVHPTKKEIRFDDSFEVSDFVLKALREALSSKVAVPEIKAETVEKRAIKTFEKPDQGVQYTFDKIKAGSLETPVIENSEVQKLKEVPAVAEEVDINNLLSNLRTEVKNETTKDNFSLEVKLPDRVPFDFDNIKPLGAIFSSYIMATDEDNFYLIDQHAAHERVFYERLVKQFNNAEKVRQTLLMPLSFNVSAQITATEETWIDNLKSIGYDIEFFGNNTYLVREIPAFMDMDEAESFLSDLFNTLEEKPDLSNKRTLERIIVRSCKSAVKAGDSLTEEEIDGLVKDLKQCMNPFSCPHGRPTFIRMTKYEIEKLFKRV